MEGRVATREKELQSDQNDLVNTQFAEREAALAQRERDVDAMLAVVIAGDKSGGTGAASQIRSLSTRLASTKLELEQLLDHRDTRLNELESTFEVRGWFDQQRLR